MVVALHSVVIGMNDTSYKYWDFLNVIESFTRMSVPLFIMITGYLLIREGEGFSMSMRRARRLAITLIFWSAIYYTYRTFGNMTLTSVIDFIGMLTRNQIFYHLWYLYAAIGFVIIIPVLSGFFYSYKKSEVIAFSLIWLMALFFGLINIQFNLGFNINWTFQTQLFSGLSVYLLLGRLLKEYKCTNRVIMIIAAILLIISVLTTAYITKLISPYGGPVNQLFYDNSSLFICISAISFMFLCMNARASNKILKNVVAVASPCTLGIYLIHPLLIDLFRIHILDANNIHPTAFVVTTMSILIFSLSFIIVFVLRKIGLSRIM